MMAEFTKVFLFLRDFCVLVFFFCANFEGISFGGKTCLKLMALAIVSTLFAFVARVVK